MKLYAAMQEISSLDTVNFNDSPETSNKYAIMEDAMKLYSRLKKKGKIHRSVLDRHRSDIAEIERLNPLTAGNEKVDVKVEMIDKLLVKMCAM